MEQERELSQYDKDRARLTKYLLEDVPPDSKHRVFFEIEQKATLMLHARELLEAAQFALSVYANISSDQFIAGGDRPARECLTDAIANAGHYGFDPSKRLDECQASIRQAIEENKARVL